MLQVRAWLVGVPWGGGNGEGSGEGRRGGSGGEGGGGGNGVGGGGEGGGGEGCGGDGGVGGGSGGGGVGLGDGGDGGGDGTGDGDGGDGEGDGGGGLGGAMAAAKALPAVKAFQAEAGRAWAEAVRVRGSYRRHLLDTKDQHIFRHASRHRQGYAPLLGSRWVSLDRHWRGIGRSSRCVLASCIALCRIVWAPPSRMARLDGSMTLDPR